MFQKTLIATAATTALIGLVSGAAQAASFTFGTGGISFDKDTTLTITFDQSHGSYQSSLGLYEVSNSSATPVSTLFYETKGSDNGGANEYLGTFGNAVASPTGVNSISVLLKAGLNYALGLASKAGSTDKGIVYSTSSLNSGGSQQAVFGTNLPLALNSTTPFANPQNFKSGDPFASAVFVSFDDRGNNNDKDFQDFTVTLKAAQVPEPATLAGLSVVAAAAWSRRRKATQAVEAET